MSVRDLGQELVTALDEATRLLEGGNAQAAAATLQGVVARCEAKSDELLSVEAQNHMRQLLERCRQAESSLRTRFLDELTHAGTSRRARSAYDR